jgi:hypothetical protein
MLNGAVALGERILDAPAAAWWQDQLWLAYRTLAGTLAVRNVPVSSDPLSGSRTDLGLAAVGRPALTSWQSKLWLAYVGPDDRHWVASSTDGRAFSALQETGVVNEWGPALSGADSLVLVWAEDAGGLVHVTTSEDGAAFEDATLGIRTRSDLGLLYDPEKASVLLAWADRAGGPGSLRIAVVDPDSATVAQTATIQTPDQARTAGVAVIGGHGGHRYLVVAEQADGSTPVGHTVSGDLTKVGGDEAFRTSATQGLAIAAGPSRAFLAWNAAGQDELTVAPYDEVFGLPHELAELIGKECEPNLCPPDPRIVCAATDEQDWVWEPANIPNARRGDLILTPADGAGLVGVLLSATTPRQYYDHMGIMVEDHTVVRHATMAHDRVKDKKYYTGSVLDAEPAPTDGIRPDHLQYGWPGTITQTIEDSFYTGFNSWTTVAGDPQTSMNPRWDYYTYFPGPKLDWPLADATPEQRKTFDDRRLFYDPERVGGPYSIHNMPDAPAYRIDTDELVFGRVVKPAPEAEAADPGLRDALFRVVDAALQIEGHYRFYAYSRGQVGIEPGSNAPPIGDPVWQGLPAGADWPAGSAGVVCSSFVWAAVQLASQHRLPRLVLEGETTESADEMLGSPPVDGLYRYPESQRQKAANALYDYLAENVRHEVRAQLAALEEKYSFLAGLARYGTAALVALLTGPVGAAAAILGTTPNRIADLVLLLNDMPNQVANQMCNTFAFDKPADVDGDGWKSPGDGLAVSPDNIKDFWDDPEPPNPKVRHGLWGHSEKLLLVEGRDVPRRRHKYARSRGVARVRGKVRFEGQPIVGAWVRIGCDSDLTRPTDHGIPEYVLEVGGGTYEVVAGAYWPGTDQWLSTQKVVALDPGDQRVDLDLEPPPAWRRIVRVTGRLDMVHQVLVGHDDWLHQPISLEVRLFQRPSGWGGPGGPQSKISDSRSWLSDSAGNERVHFSLTLTLNNDLSVSCGLSSQLLEDFWGNDEDFAALSTGEMADIVQTGENLPLFTVPEDGTHSLAIDHKDADEPPDRAHLHLTFSNERAPA